MDILLQFLSNMNFDSRDACNIVERIRLVLFMAILSFRFLNKKWNFGNVISSFGLYSLREK